MKRNRPVATALTVLIIFSISLLIYYMRYKSESRTVSIIKIEENSYLKVSEVELLKRFENNKDKFESVVRYLQKNFKDFRTNPVVINKNYGMDKINDAAVIADMDQLFGRLNFKNIDRLSDDETTRFTMDYELGKYEQGIMHTYKRKIEVGEKSKYTYVTKYKDLGNGFYYYLYHYDKLKDEDELRKIAWNSLDESSKNSVNMDWMKAVVTIDNEVHTIVTVNKGKPEVTRNPGMKYKQIVSVTFNTDVDGILGPITVYIDAKTKKIIGHGMRY